METNVYKEFASLLSDVEFLIEKNEFEIYSFSHEKKPTEIHLKWNPVFTSSAKTSITPTKPNSLDKNFTCKLCPKKLGAIRNFAHKGTKPILVLHYTSEFRKGQAALTKSNPNLTLRTRESEDLFDRLIKKVFGFSSKELFFQEYPACTFNHNSSTPEEWSFRLNSCDSHVKNTIQENGIRAIILMGSAAVLRLGAEKAKEKTGKIEPLAFGDIEVPTIVIRSPEGVFSLEDKRKKLESNKTAEAYKLAKKEEDEVKLSLVEHLTQLKNQLGLT